MGRELGIGTSQAFAKLQPHEQQQVRQAETAPVGDPAQTRKRSKQARARKAPKISHEIAAIGMLRDDQLRSRVADLLRANKHFDRAFREATTVLDSRIKKMSGIKRMNPLALVGKALNPNPDEAILVVSEEKPEQEGIHAICKGLMLAFRDPMHHDLNDKLTRNDAIKFCSFIDTVLGLVDGATVRQQPSGTT
ncbi:MAG: TIGR02391 family protein [Bacteroidota bacterium]